MRIEFKNYLESKELTWSPKTLRSEQSRLRTLDEIIPNPLPPENPHVVLWESLQGRGRYTRNLDWIRLIDVFSKTNPSLASAMIVFKRENKHAFKNAYKRKTPKISYEEARRAIEKIDEPNLRDQASCLLFSGLRVSELNSVDPTGYVVGKGGKARHVVLPVSFQVSEVSYPKLYKALKKVGLKPHDLRKIRATSLLRKGMDLKTLQERFGWSDLKSAESYLAPLSLDQSRSFYDD